MKNNKRDRISKREFPGFTLQPKDGYYKLHKIGLSAERVMVDPVFFHTRQSATDFAGALQLARDMAKVLVPATGIKSPVRLLAGAIRKGLSKDQRNPPGFRSLLQENAQSLDNLDCNRWHRWQQYMIQANPVIKREGNNRCLVTWPSTMPVIDWHLPAPYTHLRIKATVLVIQEVHQVLHTPWQQTVAMPGKRMWMPGKQMLFEWPNVKEYCCFVAVFGQWYAQNSLPGAKSWITVPGPLQLRSA
ncbi:hypothetical protein [Paraflavitalea pollutisoli]|uniref:hypothetical protein n=1 Tax=Paraflavitalea pollutisoli TaxID=3034143 RepID=UPI0023EA8DAE|nr:hypothetical protein [Paraflavitalea sp. H1-2-19X]